MLRSLLTHSTKPSLSHILSSLFPSHLLISRKAQYVKLSDFIIICLVWRDSKLLRYPAGRYEINNFSNFSVYLMAVCKRFTILFTLVWSGLAIDHSILHFSYWCLTLMYIYTTFEKLMPVWRHNYFIFQTPLWYCYIVRIIFNVWNDHMGSGCSISKL